ncbi:MAG: SPOR domain-containing protein, partial [Candidatus Cloacimonadales bacterium]
SYLEHLLADIIEQDAESYEAQLAWFELAKLKMLKRDFSGAHDDLKKIHHPEIKDKEYWLAKAYLKLEDSTRAIISAQNYVFDSSDTNKIESAYFIIAEAYLISRQYSRALNTLETLRQSAYIKNQIPLLFFKMGYCHEMMQQKDAALQAYSKLRREYPYHELTFLAEERSAAMRNGNSIDYTIENSHNNTNDNQNSGDELKTYLQAGAFGSRENAEKLGQRIASSGYDYIIFSKKSKGKTLHCVAAGPFDNENKADSALDKLQADQIESYKIKRY